MRLWLQGRLALRSPDATLTRVIPELIANGGFPERDDKTTTADRVVLMDYEKSIIEADEVGMMQHYLETSAPYTQEEWNLTLNYFDALVQVLRAKGCDVYFLRLPSGEQVGALESAFFPREQFWGSMERRLGATFIHADDHPELSGFLSTDGSHIESARIAEFTSRLITILRDKQLGGPD